MNYHEFKDRSERKDAEINDSLHFFSSKMRAGVAFILYKLGFSANGATFLFGLVGILSTVSVYLGFYLLAYILFRLHIVIDMADGSIARAKKDYSIYADGYDKVNHVLVNTSLVFALSLGNYNLSTMIILPIFLVYYLFPKLFKHYPKGVNKVANTWWKSLLKNIISFEGYVLFSLLSKYMNITIQTEINIAFTIFFIFLSLLKFRYMVNYNE